MFVACRIQLIEIYDRRSPYQILACFWVSPNCLAFSAMSSEARLSNRRSNSASSVVSGCITTFVLLLGTFQATRGTVSPPTEAWFDKSELYSEVLGELVGSLCSYCTQAKLRNKLPSALSIWRCQVGGNVAGFSDELRKVEPRSRVRDVAAATSVNCSGCATGEFQPCSANSTLLCTMVRYYLTIYH